MKRSVYMANRLREVFLDGKWIASTNYKEQIQGITRQEATLQVSDLNSIAALVFHVNYYIAGLLNVLNGRKLEISDKFSFRMPEIKSEHDWAQLVSAFLTNSDAFANKVERMEDHVLDQPFVNPRYGSYLRNIEGVIEHGYYHLGQIVLIRKLIREGASTKGGPTSD